MSASPQRYDLLASRLRGFTRTLPHVKGAQPRATERAWAAARRLREVLPILQLAGPTVEKLLVRLRKVTRRLGSARQTDELVRLIADLEKTERRGRLALGRVRDDVQRLRDRAQAQLFRRKVGNDVRRVSDKLLAILKDLKEGPDTKTQARAMQWAVKARVARRAGDLKACVTAAGSVFLAGRLHDVRTATSKLYYAAELAAEIASSVSAPDLRLLGRTNALLTSLDDVQALVERVRHVQGSLATPDLRAWKDLDRLVIALENHCRALHARYVRERETLSVLCDRLVARAPADATAKRKVS